MYQESMIKSLPISSGQIFGFCITIIISMVLLCYLITKLYKITCSKLGLIGVPKRDISLNRKLHHHRFIKIEFITQTDKTLPCNFNCSIEQITLMTGEIAKVNYKLRNKNDNYVVGEAIYNITPFTSSKYFNKLQCFCYNKMIIPQYSNIVLPLVFYIDPDICFDENIKI
ncbi:Cytochrome c oxidase assembly protein CtaG [Candidatus Hodgkinia cicadicola]|uniref:Cytochrome c oxidase assembly protein CtaG n=1 Tax=Candidatus Hodgkinia cicadicola TaxID=573658 RepID=A0ABX4MG84_9HYPH|nr:Cytochrome c oxidase assembly protein CtaG [Candidatus Hodgkinia cicadicola]